MMQIIPWYKATPYLHKHDASGQTIPEDTEQLFAVLCVGPNNIQVILGEYALYYCKKIEYAGD